MFSYQSCIQSYHHKIEQQSVWNTNWMHSGLQAKVWSISLQLLTWKCKPYMPLQQSVEIQNIKSTYSLQHCLGYSSKGSTLQSSYRVLWSLQWGEIEIQNNVWTWRCIFEPEVWIFCLLLPPKTSTPYQLQTIVCNFKSKSTQKFTSHLQQNLNQIYKTTSTTYTYLCIYQYVSEVTQKST